MNDAFVSLFGPLVYTKRDHSDLLADIDEVFVGMSRSPGDCPRPTTADNVPIDQEIATRLTQLNEFNEGKTGLSVRT